MTIERDTTVEENPEPDDGTDAVWAVTGRAVNLPFIRSSLRRRARVWVGCALAGLAIGVGYHAVVPLKYTSTATLYLAHTPGSDSTVVAQNDLAMLDTAVVGDRALAILGMKGVTGTKFLGKQPGTIASGNVLVITMTGSSQRTAVRRVDAVATAYLDFRAQEYRAQNDAIVAAAEAQEGDLKTKITELTAEISGLSRATVGQVSTLTAERATATTELTTLQQSIQQDDLDTQSVIKSSRVITPGTLVDVSKKRVFGLDGLMGLVGGLGLGVFLVVAQASLSDRVRRREDLAGVLGAPVVVSVGHVKKRRFGLLRRSVRDLAAGEDRPIAVLGRYFSDLSASSGGMPVMIVAADDPEVPAAAVLAVARKLAEGGRRVVLVDVTEERVVSSQFGTTRPGRAPVRLRTSLTVTLVSPPKPWEDVVGRVSETDRNVFRRADAVFVVASFGPETGAWHLREWGSQAVVTVSSGTSTIQRIATLSELLEAAGIGVRTAVLLDSDPLDDSPGLPVPGVPVPGLRLGVVRANPSEAS